MDSFFAECKQHKLKMTPQRVAIYEELKDDKTHPTANSVYKKLHKKYPNISLDTVNRTLINFAELGIIDTVLCSCKGRRFDPNTNVHHHFECISCGKVYDLEDKKYNELASFCGVKKGFKVLKTKVVFTGLCDECNPKQN